MTERSQFWTTGTTGDGSTTITEAQTVEFFRKIFTTDQQAAEGVLLGVDNELAVSGVSSPVAVATGAAMVSGFYYQNDASLNVTIPTPAANTRIDRIVLRASYGTTRTVRVTRIAGTEGAGAPALTQTAGTTWDIPLAQVSITTGGVITVTDQRSFCHFATRVNQAMLDADIVDDTKVGNRVPALIRREGGHATDWAVPGTTEYTPGAVRMQCGVAEMANGQTNLLVTLPVAFSGLPIVFLTVQEITGGTGWYFVEDVLVNAFEITRSTSTGPTYVGWLAIGPE